MAFYLPNFDCRLRGEHPWDRIPLDDELVYSCLVEEIVLISAASPFKSLPGWRVLQRLLPLVKSGIVRFPLDSRHNNLLENYVESRFKKLSNDGSIETTNPEIAGYRSPMADNILSELSTPICAAPRPIDCDTTFRTLVFEDAVSETHESINGLLHGKKLGWGKEEFLTSVAEKARDSKTLFHRFSILDDLGVPLIIDSVMRQRICSRIDTLFFKANAIAAGCNPDPVDF
jgi:hypothetical protein